MNDAEIGDAMTKRVAVLKSAEALIHHLGHSSVVDDVDRQTIADIVAILRACKAPAPDARQEAWRAGIEAAAKVACDCIYYDSAGNGFDEDNFDAAIRQLKKGPDHD